MSAKSIQLERHQRQLDLIERRRNSLTRRCNELGQEIDRTIQTVDPVLGKKKASPAEDAPFQKLCFLGIIQQKI